MNHKPDFRVVGIAEAPNIKSKQGSGESMLSGQALRHQMVLPEQQAIYDYWRSKCVGGKIPARGDIDPAVLKNHLPMMTLTEASGEPERKRFQCRLAGTGFWDLFNDEIQGRYIDELPLGDRVDYWHRILTRVMKNRRPAAGVTRPGTPYGGHLAQFWIRMPLSSNGNDVNMILGYDQLVKVSDLPKMRHEPECISA